MLAAVIALFCPLSWWCSRCGGQFCSYRGEAVMTEYERMLLAINSANLTANIENVSINEDILERQKRHEGDNAKIIALLT